MGLGVGLRVCVGLCWLLNTAGAALWASLLRLIARSRLKQLFERVSDPRCCLFFFLTEFAFNKLNLSKENVVRKVKQLNQPFLQSQTSLVAALAFDWIHRLGSSPVVCHMSVSVFASEMRLTCRAKLKRGIRRSMQTFKETRPHQGCPRSLCQRRSYVRSLTVYCDVCDCI